MRKKHYKKILVLLWYYNDHIIIDTKHCFYADEMLFELFCIENGFCEIFLKMSLFRKYFMSHITIIFQNDIFFWKNKTFLWCMILQKCFSDTRAISQCPCFFAGGVWGGGGGWKIFIVSKKGKLAIFEFLGVGERIKRGKWIFSVGGLRIFWK